MNSTLDCLTPALLAQAAAALLYSVNVAFRSIKQHVTEQQQHVGRRAWVLALGLLHLMSSTLTLASFGMSTVSHTYIIRTLEPIISCVLLYVIYGQKRSLQELGLLAAVAVATAFGVLGPQQQEQQLLHETVDSTGHYIPAALALVATCIISCRSVASKAVAGLTGTSEYDTFLEASVPG